MGLIKFFVGGGPAFAPIAIAKREQLYALFRPEVEKLEELLQRDLSAWKSLERGAEFLSADSRCG